MERLPADDLVFEVALPCQAGRFKAVYEIRSGYRRRTASGTAALIGPTEQGDIVRLARGTSTTRSRGGLQSKSIVVRKAGHVWVVRAIARWRV